MKSGCPGSEWIGVGGTWLQLMCCAASRRHVPNFGGQGQGRGSEIGDDFVVRQKSDKDDKGRVPSVLEPVKLLVFGMHTQSPKSFYRDVTNKKRNLILCCSTTPEII